MDFSCRKVKTLCIHSVVVGFTTYERCSEFNSRYEKQ